MKLFIVLVSLFVFGNAYEYSDCGSKAGEWSKVSVTDCSTDKKACVLKRNTNVTISIDFQSYQPVATVKAVVYGHILGADIPFPLPNSDGCTNCGLACPVSANETQHYSTTLSVLKAYPKVDVKVKWELQDENGNNIICAQIPAKIE